MERHSTLVISEYKLEGDGLVSILNDIAWLDLISESVNIQRAKEQFNYDDTGLVIFNQSHNDTELIYQITGLKNHFRSSKFFIIAPSNSISIVSQLLKIGISGYFLKTSCKENLIHAIQNVVDNEIFLPEDVSQKLLHNFILQNQNTTNLHDESCLTKRERDILKLLVNAESSSQIAGELFISELTVNTHRKHILKKMGFNNTASLIKYALQNGLV